MSDEFLHVSSGSSDEPNRFAGLQQQILTSIREVSNFCMRQRGNLSSHKNASESEHPEIFKDRANQMHVYFEKEILSVLEAGRQLEASHQEIKGL